jgi:chromosome segregation ATPase
MKIRSIELTNFKKFVGTVRVDTIGDNVNVLVGRNELGKSTLLQATTAVIFDKARSTASHVKAFRHFLNGTVPEVKMTFDIGDKSWAIHKRFAGQAGKAVLQCSDGRVFEDDAAEVELQRLLGFAGGRGGGEPGIWGTLWVQQGKSFGDIALDETAQRTIQGCLEAQVGLVTGGARGQKIPKAVRETLDELRNQRGPRGKFKEATERLAEVRVQIDDLATKAKSVSSLMTDLAQNRHDLRTIQADWDEAAHRAELDEERNKRTTAAMLAAEIAGARESTHHARERATVARQVVKERSRVAIELQGLEVQLTEVDGDLVKSLEARGEAKASADAAELKLTGLRQQVSANAEASRRLNRVSAAATLNSDIRQHEATLDRAVTLEGEAAQLSELLGAIAATDEVVTRIEEAATEKSAAEAATNAVATSVSFAVEGLARQRIAVDGKPLNDLPETIPVLGKATIAIEAIGTIIVEPQIKNRSTLLKRQQNAADEWTASLEAAGVTDLAAARLASAQRKEYERSVTAVRKELANLAPGNRQKKIAAGLEALKSHVGELRGRLKSEMEKLKLTVLLEGDELDAEVAKNHEEGTRLAGEVALAEAALAGPHASLARADKELRDLEGRQAALQATVATRRADLNAARTNKDDMAIAETAAALESEAEQKERELSDREKTQGETVEAIDARIWRLEAAARNHHDAVAKLNTEIARVNALIEANEGIGVEEMLTASEADRDRLTETVAEYETEIAVLELLLTTLEAAERDAKNRYLAPVVSRVQPYLKMLLPGTDIVLDENLQIAGLHRDGQREDFEVLSGGTQEQLAVLTRIAFAELLLAQHRPATVILDDALAFSDDDRIESMFDVLMRASKQVQIIVLTCRKRLFTRLGASPLEIRKIN